MTNRPRQIGTRYEVELLAQLQSIWPTAERAPLKGIRDRGDYTGVPMPVEAKNTKALAVPEWARRLNKVTTGAPVWVLFHSGRDRRLASSHGELMVVPAAFGRSLLAAWAEKHAGVVFQNIGATE